MRLFLLVFVAKTLVKHVAHSLRILKIFMCKYMRQWNYHITMIADDARKVTLCFVSKNLHNWSKQQAEKSVNHRYVWQTSRVAAKKSTCFVIKVLASKRSVNELCYVSFVREVVDRVLVEVNKRILVHGLEAEFVQVVWSF